MSIEPGVVVVSNVPVASTIGTTIVRVREAAEVVVTVRPEVRGLIGANWLSISNCLDSTETAELSEDDMAAGSWSATVTVPGRAVTVTSLVSVIILTWVWVEIEVRMIMLSAALLSCAELADEEISLTLALISTQPSSRIGRPNLHAFSPVRHK